MVSRKADIKKIIKRNSIKRKTRLLMLIIGFLSCDHAGIRTQDPILKRDVLYQLSYIIILDFESAKVPFIFKLTKYILHYFYFTTINSIYMPEFPSNKTI